jgi:two-component system, chemotaxis family, protein-glutamate methylesterase/glutaminase
MGKIRILVVDDSVVVRRLVADLLSSDPLLEVVASAPNGRVALAKLPQVNPDLVILDVVMADMDGLETLTELRKTYPRLPVIMLSALTERGAAVTLEAIARGATDYVAKPTTLGGRSGGTDTLRDQLISKIKGLCPANGSVVSPTVAERPAQRAWTLGDAVNLVAIGTSTGGPNALSDLLITLPADFPVPIVIVQHMPPLFTKFLADRLASKCRIRVDEGVEGGLLRPGHAWIAPGGYHMTLVRESDVVRLALNQNPPENSCRPAIDVLFRSAAEVFGASTLGVVLTGMGFDGLRGSERICAAGGRVLVQDPATAVVATMPGAIVQAGLADRVLPLDQIGAEIVRRARAARPALANGNFDGSSV